MDTETTANLLSLSIDLDEDGGIAGLFGRLEANGFKGHGEGWFNLSEIKRFCRSFEKMIKAMDGESELLAGQSNGDGSDYLECFGLRCSVVAATGIIGVHVTLSDYPYSGCRLQEISKVSAELKVEAQSASEFIQGLRGLCSGVVTTVILTGR